MLSAVQCSAVQCRFSSGLSYPETPHLFLEFHGSEDEVSYQTSFLNPHGLTRPECKNLVIGPPSNLDNITQVLAVETIFLFISCFCSIFTMAFAFRQAMVLVPPK